ncbi:hypothetical protein AMTRI_Chr09g40070 [Amborella trichopoda]
MTNYALLAPTMLSATLKQVATGFFVRKKQRMRLVFFKKGLVRRLWILVDVSVNPFLCLPLAWGSRTTGKTFYLPSLSSFLGLWTPGFTLLFPRPTT